MQIIPGGPYFTNNACTLFISGKKMLIYSYIISTRPEKKTRKVQIYTYTLL